MREVVIAANWKMHTTPADAGDLARTIAARTREAGVTRVICPPFVCLAVVRDTLAEDLMKALADLRDTGSHIESHQPRVWGEARSDEIPAERTSGGAGTPEVILAPSTAPAMRNLQPAWLRGGREPEPVDSDARIELPGVTVQSFDGDDDGQNAGAKLYNGFSISSVTSRSMCSGMSVGRHCTWISRVTKSSRPPCALTPRGSPLTTTGTVTVIALSIASW